jgi:hypothetical protein
MTVCRHLSMDKKCDWMIQKKALFTGPDKTVGKVLAVP